MDSITHIEKGNIKDAYLKALAGIVYEAFETKITAIHIRKDVALEILLNSSNPDSAFFAYRENRLVGVAGVITKNSRFLHFRLKELMRHFNPLRALFYTLVLNIPKRIHPGEYKVESLVVPSEMRGQGIGTSLMKRVEQFAVENGYSILSLNVVDTNTGAIKLYERLGFDIVRTARYGILTRRAGFTGSHYMRKTIAKN